MQLSPLAMAVMGLCSVGTLAADAVPVPSPVPVRDTVAYIESLYQGEVVAIALDASGDKAAHYHVDLRYPGPVTAPLEVDLIAEAIVGNPDINAAQSEKEAARQRVASAGSLDDPMLEAGLLNVPTTSWRLNREDIKMKMLGISQRLPAPGKRALRREVAAKDAEAVEQAFQETVNRVARDIRIAFYELGLAVETTRLLKENTRVLEQFLSIADGRYSAGQGTQADVLKAQAQLARMEELLRMQREIPVLEEELARLVGVEGGGAPIAASLPEVRDVALEFAASREAMLSRRPQLIALRRLVDKANAAVDLARKEFSFLLI